MRTPADMPPWLNMYQLLAWVEYRDLSVLAKSVDWYGLGGQHVYGSEPRIGRAADLERALQEGRLTAQGRKPGETFVAIPAIEWTRLPVAPLDIGRHHPYSRIQVKCTDALAIFPPVNSGEIDRMIEPSNRQLDHSDIVSKASVMLADQPNLSKGSAAASIVAELPANPRTGKPRDTRHIERMIAHLWEGNLGKSPS